MRAHDVARKLHATVRNAEVQFKRPIGILCDLQGPKFRVGEMGGGRTIVADGTTFHFDRDEAAGSADRIFLPHPQIFEAIQPGHTLLLDDGKLRMQVIEVIGVNAHYGARSIVGGALASRKGIAMPDTLAPDQPYH